MPGILTGIPGICTADDAEVAGPARPTETGTGTGQYEFMSTITMMIAKIQKRIQAVET